MSAVMSAGRLGMTTEIGVMVSQMSRLTTWPMLSPSTTSPRAAGVHRFALRDELGRPVGIFTSHRLGWRIGDWVLMHDGRRFQIVGILPATYADESVSEVWLVEPA